MRWSWHKFKVKLGLCAEVSAARPATPPCGCKVWADGALRLDDRQLQALLKEYELSTNLVSHFETIAWQLMAAIPAAALAGLWYVLLGFHRDCYHIALLG